MTSLQNAIHLSNITFHEKPPQGLLEKSAEEHLVRRGLQHSQKAHSSVRVYQFPQGLGRKGRLLQSYIIIKVACGDDLIGLSFKLSFCEMPNKHQLLCIPFFLIEICFESSEIQGRPDFNFSFICACRLADPKELLCRNDDKTKQM